MSGIEIHRAVWHSDRVAAVNLDSGFSCTGLVQVSWQRGSVTLFQGCAEGDPGVTLQWVCLGAQQGGWGAGTLGRSVLSAGVSPRLGPRWWTMPAHCAGPIDSGCSGTLPWVPSMGSLRARGISLMGRQELLWLQTLGQRAQNKHYDRSRSVTYTSTETRADKGRWRRRVAKQKRKLHENKGKKLLDWQSKDIDTNKNWSRRRVISGKSPQLSVIGRESLSKVYLSQLKPHLWAWDILNPNQQDICFQSSHSVPGLGTRIFPFQTEKVFWGFRFLVPPLN